MLRWQQGRQPARCRSHSSRISRLTRAFLAHSTPVAVNQHLICLSRRSSSRSMSTSLTATALANRTDSTATSCNKLQAMSLALQTNSESELPVLPALKIPPGNQLSSITVCWDHLQLQLMPEANLDSSKAHKEQVGRLLLQHGSHMFVTVNFSQLYQHDNWERRKKAPEFIKQVLSQGIKINGQSYHFIGSSAGQLKEKTAVLFQCDTAAKAWQLLQGWGAFGKMQSVAKLYKRIGLMFSGVSPVAVHHIRHIEIADIERDGYCFTDGCGVMSHRLATEIMAREEKIRIHGRHYLPSVYQFRYKGYKGVVHVDTPDKEFMQHALMQAKGLDPSAAASEVKECDLMLRKSQRKVDGVGDNTFGLVASSLPYKFGYLNQQFVMLLSELGISDEVLLSRQSEYFAELQHLMQDPTTAMCYLLLNDKFALAEQVAGLPDDSYDMPPAVAAALQAIRSKEVKGCIKETKVKKARLSEADAKVSAAIPTRLDQPTQCQQTTETAGNLPQHSQQACRCGGRQPAHGLPQQGEHSSRNSDEHRSALAHSEVPRKDNGGDDSSDDPEFPDVKLRFKLTRSRLAFGIPDATGLLQYGQAFFQPEMDGEATMIKGCAVVARSPSYHPGDIRVLQLVEVPELAALKDVLVFPVLGHRPHADECSGGDYDGDQFFVCWDEGLIPSKQRLRRWPPMSYAGQSEAVVAQVDHAALVKYFAEYDPFILGRLNKCFIYWAQQKGPGCPQCVEIAQLFSQGVDSVKSGVKTAIPARLKPPQQLSAATAAASPVDSAAESGMADATGRPAATAEDKSQTVDSSKAAIKTVWQQLVDRARSFVHGWYRQQLQLSNSSSSSTSTGSTAAGSASAGGPAAITCGLSYPDMMELLDMRDIGATEFDLLRLAVSWFHQHGATAGVDLVQLVDNLDFSRMTAEQCSFAMAAGVSRDMVYNDLTRSLLLSPLQSAKLGGLGRLRWRLIDAGLHVPRNALAGSLTSANTWSKLLSACTRFPKKLLLLQCHDPPQVIALYLPHQYPGEGVYPCQTLRSDGQTLTAMTWAFGVDGYSSMQRLSGHLIDLDEGQRRLQVYIPPAVKDGGHIPLRDLPGQKPTKNNSYLWFRLSRRPVAKQAAQPASGRWQAYGRQPQQHSAAVRQGHAAQYVKRISKQRQQGVSSLYPPSGKSAEANTGRSMIAPAGATNRKERQYGTATSPPPSQPSAATLQLDQMLLSVAVLRFEPSKKGFQHFTKTNKAPINGYEIYAITCEPEQSVMDLPGTLDAYYTIRPLDQSSSSSSSNAVHSLVAPVQLATEAEAAEATRMLQLLPGAVLHSIPAQGEDAAADLGSPASPLSAAAAVCQSTTSSPVLVNVANVQSSLQAPGRQSVAAVTSAYQQHRSGQQQRQQQQMHSSAWNEQLEHQASRRAANIAPVVNDPVAAVRSVHQLVAELADQDKLVTAVALVEGLCSCTDHHAFAANSSLWPRTWSSCFAAAARLQQSSLGAQLLHLMLLQQQKHTAQKPGPVGGFEAAFVQAVRLCSNVGLLRCCPTVVLALWGELQQHLHQQQQTQTAGTKQGNLVSKPSPATAAALLNSCGDGVFYELVVAVMRSASSIPEVTGSTLQQLLTLPSFTWTPNRLNELLLAAVDQCTNRAVARDVLLPCIVTAAAAAMLPRGTTTSAGSSSSSRPDCNALEDIGTAAVKYQLHFAEALTAKILCELQQQQQQQQQQPAVSEVGATSRAAGDSSFFSSSSSSSRNATKTVLVSDHIAAAADRQGFKPLYKQLSSISSSLVGNSNAASGSSSSSSRHVITYVSVVECVTLEHETDASAAAALADQGNNAHDTAATAAESSGSGSCRKQKMTAAEDDGRSAHNSSPATEAAAAAAAAKPLTNYPCVITVRSLGSTATAQLQCGDLVRLTPQNIPAELLSANAQHQRLDITAADILWLLAAAASSGDSTAGSSAMLRSYNTQIFSIEGRVVELEQQSAGAVKIQLPWQPVEITSRHWQIEVLGNVITYARCMQGLCDLVQQLRPLSNKGSKMACTSSQLSRCIRLQEIIVSSWQLQSAPDPEYTTIAAAGSSSSSTDNLKLLAQQLKAAGQQQPGLDSINSTGCVAAASSNNNQSLLPTVCQQTGDDIRHTIDKLTSGAGGSSLNAAQRAAVLAAVSQQLTLIWGPPGTGKTHTIVQLLRCLLAQHQAHNHNQPLPPILVCAETHTAVDNIMIKLLATSTAATSSLSMDGGGGNGGNAAEGLSKGVVRHQDVLRIAGSLERVSPELRRCTIHAEGDRVTNTAGFLDKKKLKDLLTTKRVVFATCAAAGASALAAVAGAGVKFDTVVVDEASQVLEPCCLLPLLLGPAQRLVLVGDHKQLGPTVEPAVQQYRLQVSLFERLQAAGVSDPFMLHDQYRMHSDIAALPSACFYDGRLETIYDSQSCPPLPHPLSPGIYCINISGTEQSRGSSKVNLQEAAAAIRLLHKLLSPAAYSTSSSSGNGGPVSSRLQPHQIGTITPYKAMVAELSRMVANAPALKGVEISTVDAFQGREKAVILFCSVRSNSGGQLGFVSDHRRLNVAMTRAQHLLVLIGDMETLAADDVWAQWVAKGRDLRI